jgi:hypothetical protein
LLIAFTHNITVPIAILAVIAIVTGLVFVFYGRGLFKTVLFLGGLYLFATLAFIILSNVEPMNADGSSGWGDRRDTIYLCVCLAVGVVGGLLVMCVWKVGLFALGCIGGFFLAMFILSWASSGLISQNVGRSVFIVILTLVGGVAALFLEHHVVIIATSIAGAYAVGAGIDVFARTGMVESTKALLTSNPGSYQIDNKGVYGILVGMLVLAVLGMIVQYRITGKHARHGWGK